MGEGFELEGITYRQEYRKCGKANCRTCTEGPGHGPYWYGRDQATGKRAYHGKELAPEIRNAYHWRRRNLWRLDAYRDAAAAQLRALDRLRDAAALDAQDRRTLEALGLGACLVFGRADEPAQDLDELPIDQLLRRLGYPGLWDTEEPEEGSG